MKDESRKGSEQILRLANAITDETPIAWSNEGTESEAGLASGTLDALRLLEKVASVYRAGSPATHRERPAFRWGPLLVYEKLGEGTFGEVFRAHDPRLERDVALKLRRTELGELGGARAFLDEARRLARVRHPNVLTIYGADFHEERAGLWTDLVRGRTLKARLAGEGSLPVAEVAAIGIQVCRALAAVHAADLIHGDLSPANLMEDASGHVLLTDFGAVTERRPSDGGTVAGPSFGTPLFMAPELFEGEAPGPASDLYSLAALLFQLVSGRPPIDAATIADLMEIHRAGKRLRVAELLPELPEWLAVVLDRALAARPNARYASATEMERALAGPKSTPHNLPSPVTRFVGRRQLLADIAARVSTARLVTLLGPGGAGKTRLSVEASRRLLTEHPGGVWLAELAACADESLVALEVARMLGVRESSADAIVPSIVERLGSHPTLLVLDNCEHVLGAAARLVKELTSGVPHLRVLATSREPLRVAGEVLVTVPPLSVPHENDAEPAESLELFVDRARSVRHDFVLTPENRSSAIDICARLDGIPLAIELAAARLRSFTLEEIALRLGDRFRFLGRGDRTALPRHQTLRALIDWSYDQLDPSEALLFQRLSVFAGGWTLEAAERVCAGEGIEEADVIDTLTRLVDRSLVDTISTAASAGTRYRMLETIQTYAREKLSDVESVRLARWHRDHFVAFAETCEMQMVGAKPAVGFARAEADMENFRVALVPRGDAAEPDARRRDLVERARIAGALSKMWAARGHWVFGAAACRSLLEQRKPDDRTLPWAKLLNGAGLVDLNRGDFESALAEFADARELYRELGDDRRVAGCYNNISLAAATMGDLAAAEQSALEALAINRRLGNREWELSNLQNLGLICDYAGRPVEARRHLEAAVPIARSLNSIEGLAYCINNLANLVDNEGRSVEACALYEEAIDLARKLASPQHLAATLNNYALCLAKLKDADRAWEAAKESTEIKRSLGVEHVLVYAFETLAEIAELVDRPERSAWLFHTANVLRERARVPRPPSERSAADAFVERLKSALGEEGFEVARGLALSMSVDEAVDKALREGP